MSEQTKIILVTGRKGTGKTTYLRKDIKKNNGKKDALIIDTMGKFNTQSYVQVKGFNDFIHKLNITEGIATYRLNSIDDNEIIHCIYLAYMFGNFVIYVDEADIVFHQNCHGLIKEVIRRGRNQGIDLMLATLRPYAVNPDLRGQVDYLVIFSFKRHADLKSIVDEFSCIGLEREILALKGHDYIVYNINSTIAKKYGVIRPYEKSGKYSTKVEV